MIPEGEELVCLPAPGIDTLLKAFKRSVERYPNEPYLGTRDPNQEGRPYIWKTWGEVDTLTTDLAYGKLSLPLFWKE